LWKMWIYKLPVTQRRWVSQTILFFRQLFATKLRTAVVLTFCCLFSFLVYVKQTNKCDMTPNLKAMLLFTVNLMNTHNVPYWLDYGTLLGAVRDKAIIPWEFDLDFGIPEDQCDKLLSFKDELNAQGDYTMYGRKDYIPQKANPVLGYSGYMSSPCVRIYDRSKQYYVDIYWHREVQPKEAHELTKFQELYPPSNFLKDDESPSNTLICNAEGYSNSQPGGCKLKSSIYPLKTIMLYDTIMSIPNNPEDCLTQMYGSDWNKPIPKGYKAIVCRMF